MALEQDAAPSALKVIASTLAAILTPPEKIKPSDWAKNNLVIVDGPRAGQLWDPSFTPYIVEVLDEMAEDSPVTKSIVRKCVQSGFTTVGMAWIGFVAAIDPCRMGVVQPNDSGLMDFLREKLNPTIDQTPALRRKVQEQKSRSAAGSTTYSKRFPGGSLSCMIASSVNALASKTLKYIFKDEASKYPLDLQGQGSAHDHIKARYTAFLPTGDWKELSISTPTIDGECWISEQFEAGDQSYLHVPCPGCGDKFHFKWDLRFFRFKKEYPYQAHYVAPCCGTVIENHQRAELIRKGEWIATQPGPGRHRSRHADFFISPMLPFDVVAQEYIEAQGDPTKLKAFYNLKLALPYKMETDVPDSTRLLERREEYPRRFVPPRGLLLVATADVQMRGIYVLVKAYAPNRESWVVDAEYLDGETSSAHDGAFLKLDEVYQREYTTAYGEKRRVDAFGVDSGYRSNEVYNWCRLRPGAMALDGRPGWNRPAISTARPVDIDLNGKKIAKGASVYPVGTWNLKATYYSDLRKEGKRAGQEVDPPGYCHFPHWLDEDFFRQITAEYLKVDTSKGRATHTWERFHGRDNHYLDCEVYALALAYWLGLDRMTAEEWVFLARQHGLQDFEADIDLFQPESFKATRQMVVPSTTAPQTAEEKPEAAQETAQDGWFSGRNRNWFKR